MNAPAYIAELVGRDQELALLTAVFETVAAGEGRIVLLTGDEGSGKTVLAEAALTRFPGPAFTGRARERSTPPYGPVAAALRECLRHTDVTLVQDSLLPYLALLLPELGPPPEHVDPETIVEAISSTFSAAAADRGAAIFFDDLHWADNATLELLPALADRLAAEPIVIIGTYRDDEVSRAHLIRRMRYELRRTRRLEEIVVQPLAHEHTEELIARCVGFRPGPSLTREIVDRTLGIPLFVEEFVRALESGGRLQIESGMAELVPGESVPVPDSVRDAILLRLDGLSRNGRALLDLAAVMGLESDLAALTVLHGGNVPLEELLDRGVLRETETGRAAFRHALIHETVRNQISWSQRLSLHARVGAHLEANGAPPEEVAEHWLAAHESTRARAALLKAAEHSCRLHAYRDAARAIDRALEIWPPGDDDHSRLAAVERFARCAQIGGQLTEAARAWREVVDSPLLEGDFRRRAEALRALATVYGLQGAVEKAVEARRQAAEAFRAADCLGDAASEMLAAALRLNATTQLTAALDAVQQAITWAEQAGLVDIQARALGLKGDILAMQGKYDAGRETAHAGLTLALKHNQTEAASEVYRRLAIALASASDYSASRKVFTTAVDYCRSEGVDVHTQVCLSCMSYVLFMTGDWKRTVEVCSEVLASKASPPGSRVTAEGVLGIVRAYRGEFRMARKNLADCITSARRLNIAAMHMTGLWGMALIDDYEGATESAAERYRTLLDFWKQTQDLHDVIPALCSAATFFAGTGHEADTSRCAESLAHIASATGNLEALAGLAYALGELSMLGGKISDSVQQFAQAVQNLDRLEIPIGRAHTEWRYGVALSRAGDNSEAITHLRAGYRTARKLAARPLAARISEDLAALGETPEERRSIDAAERADKAGLTSRQLEVARLIADGLTNRQIGRKLFLSTRTVDMHVANILSRLDCRSRTDAVRRIADLGLIDKSA